MNEQANTVPEERQSQTNPKPTTDAEKVIWSHAYWARLNHENEKFIPTQAKAVADETLRHARDAGVVDVMAAELKVTK